MGDSKEKQLDEKVWGLIIKEVDEGEGHQVGFFRFIQYLDLLRQVQRNHVQITLRHILSKYTIYSNSFLFKRGNSAYILSILNIFL